MLVLPLARHHLQDSQREVLLQTGLVYFVLVGSAHLCAGFRNGGCGGSVHHLVVSEAPWFARESPGVPLRPSWRRFVCVARGATIYYPLRKLPSSYDSSHSTRCERGVAFG